MGEARVGRGERGFSSARRDFDNDCRAVAAAEGAEARLTLPVLYSLDLWLSPIFNHAPR